MGTGCLAGGSGKHTHTHTPWLSVIGDSALARLGALPRAAPTVALHGPLSLKVGSLVKGVVVPVRGLVGRLSGLTSCAFTPQPVRGLVDAGSLTRALHAPPLPACGLGGPGLGLRTTTGAVGFTCVTVCGLDEYARTLLAVTGPCVIVRGHTGPVTGHGIGCFSPLTVHGRGIEVGSLGRVTGIMRRLLQPPGIAATLG